MLAARLKLCQPLQSRVPGRWPQDCPRPGDTSGSPCVQTHLCEHDVCLLCGCPGFPSSCVCVFCSWKPSIDLQNHHTWKPSQITLKGQTTQVSFLHETRLPVIPLNPVSRTKCLSPFWRVVCRAGRLLLTTVRLGTMILLLLTS